MELHEIHQGPVLIIAPQGRLDSGSAPHFEKQLMERLADCTHLVLDFSALDFLSSAGLRVLVKAVKQIDRDEGRLILCHVSPPIHEVLEISGFLGLLEVVDTRAQALEAMPS